MKYIGAQDDSALRACFLFRGGDADIALDVAQALLPVPKAKASHAEHTGKSACATVLLLPSGAAPNSHFMWTTAKWARSLRSSGVLPKHGGHSNVINAKLR